MFNTDAVLDSPTACSQRLQGLLPLSPKLTIAHGPSVPVSLRITTVSDFGGGGAGKKATSSPTLVFSRLTAHGVLLSNAGKPWILVFGRFEVTHRRSLRETP